jgi:cation diffusion facilitator family transporter
MKISKVTFEDLYEFKDLYNNENCIYYAISFEHRIFGYLIFKANENKLEIIDIYIKEGYRNSGYGSKLLNYSIHDSLNYGFNNVHVKYHKRLNNFLEKNDFIDIDGVYVRNDIKEEIEHIHTIIHINKLSIAINILLSIIKLFCGYVFSLNSLIADGINSLSDLINNVLVLIGAKIEIEPNDEDHPFGHGKVESIFSLIIGLLIIFSSLNTLRNGFINLIKNNVTNIGKSEFKIMITILLFLIIVKIIQYIYVSKVSKKVEVPLINAIIVDYKLDIILTTSVLLGIIGVIYINPVIDSVLSIVITIYLIIQGYWIVRENSLILMDSQDENLLLNIKLLTLKVEGIENIHDVYMTRVGENIYVIADIRMNGNLSVEEAHDIAVISEKNIKFRYSNIKKVIYHIEPNYIQEEK